MKYSIISLSLFFILWSVFAAKKISIESKNCTQSAAISREDAIIAGVTQFHQSQLDALKTRKSTISSWDTVSGSVAWAFRLYQSAMRQAREKLHYVKKESWMSYRDTVKSCQWSSVDMTRQQAMDKD